MQVSFQSKTHHALQNAPDAPVSMPNVAHRRKGMMCVQTKHVLGSLPDVAAMRADEVEFLAYG
jgi:hypothetical protein